MHKHADYLAKSFQKRFDLNAKSLVVEIASNDGTVLQYFKKTGVKTLGVEPAANIARVAVRSARELNPAIVVLTRTKRVSDMDELWDQGSTEVIAEEFEASLELITRILQHVRAPEKPLEAHVKFERLAPSNT